MALAMITTIKERCRMCYTCVRECPAKAIRVVTGQAEVVAERCIACGNCVKVCSQKAKRIRSSIEQVNALLTSGQRVAACLAPSFPAEFPELEYQQLVGQLRRLGFDPILEVSFGADLVAGKYREMLDRANGHRYIATTCPAIASYVEKYYPDMVGSLASIVSPMIATARVAHQIYGPDLRVVFLGPCIAKKNEAGSDPVKGDVDAVLTFTELRTMLQENKDQLGSALPSDFDPPQGASGALFPIGGGMLQAANIREDLMTGEVFATEGRAHVLEAIKEFADGDLGSKLLEVLCCEGCVMGPGIDNDLPLFHRRRLVRRYVCRRIGMLDPGRWSEHMDRFADLNLTRTFQANDQRIPMPVHTKLAEIMIRLGKLTPQDELNCGACGYDTCREHALAIFKGFAEKEMCLPHTIDQLNNVVQELARANQELASTQEALVHSEKMASMGQLAAGIAHEVNNPLGVVLMYAHLLLEDCPRQSPLKEDLTMIAEEADRCKKIVAGLLHFARQNKVSRNPVDLRDVVDRTLRTLQIPEGIEVRTVHEMTNPVAEIDRDQIVQVLANLINNALAAMDRGGVLTVRTSDDESRVRLFVEDTGVGVPPENLKKVFEPFFTTKPKGKGTGLGRPSPTAS